MVMKWMGPEAYGDQTSTDLPNQRNDNPMLEKIHYLDL